MINIFYGPVINPKSLREYDALPRCLLAVGSDGNILWIENDVDPSAVDNTIALRGLKPDEYKLEDYTFKPCEFIMPGLIDAHVHACQFPMLGYGGDLQLLDWLFQSVFPVEAKFEDQDYAEVAYKKVVDRTIACGTTTSCYYGSRHLHATMQLAKIVHDKGQRAFVGRCNMDWNCPGYYIDRTPEESLKETIELIEYIRTLSLAQGNEALVNPIIAPRFALSCSDELLTKLGELAAKMPKVPIQTHVCENRREIEDTKRRFNAESYAGVYDRFGLLRENTILGHGVWLTEKEMELIRARGAGVAHCPTSNFYLSSGMARVGLLLDHGVKVGLGTDISGGYNPSVLYTIQMASTASKMVAVQAEVEEERRRERRDRRCCRHHSHKCCRGQRTRACCDDWEEDEEDEDEEVETCHHRDHAARNHHHAPALPHPPFANRKLDTATLLYLATLGGADLCALQSRIGSFEVGKAFDALYVSLDDAHGNPAVWGAMVDEEERKPVQGSVRRWLERFLFTGDDRNIRRVWVQGAGVGGAEGKVPEVKRLVNGAGAQEEPENKGWEEEDVF